MEDAKKKLSMARLHQIIDGEIAGCDKRKSTQYNEIRKKTADNPYNVSTLLAAELFCEEKAKDLLCDALGDLAGFAGSCEEAAKIVQNRINKETAKLKRSESKVLESLQNFFYPESLLKNYYRMYATKTAAIRLQRCLTWWLEEAEPAE